jgi:hypothetical protein
MPNRDGTLKAREFLFAAEDLAMAALPPRFPQPERRVMWTILQFHYGDPNVHFELQPQVSRGQVEAGLHFEGLPENNEAWAQLIADNAAPIAGALGPDWELEEWTASWRRLHRVFPFQKLTRTLAAEVAAEFALLLTTLQQLVADGVAEFGMSKPEAEKRGPSRNERWHRKRARR